MDKTIGLFILAVSYCTTAVSYNILFVDEILSPSHQIWNYAIVEALLAKGHNITLIGPKTIDVIVHENYSMFELHGVHDKIVHITEPNKVTHYGAYDNIDLVLDYALVTCHHYLETSSLKRLLEYPEDFKFDLIIVDMSLGGCLLPLIRKFNYPPSIGVCPFLLVPYVSDAFGNDVNPAEQPHLVSSLTDQMSYFERVQNFMYTIYDKFVWDHYYLPEWTEAAETAFGEDMATWEELNSRLSLLLSNIMVGFPHPRPLTPNIIPVGGLHIKPAKELPEDLQEIFDNSKHGVIIFSLGTNIRTSDIQKEKVQMILDALSRLKETVIWKFDLELSDVPKNVILRKWLPQKDILAHNKTKLFISHCGALSTMESIYYGVPIVAVPFIVDQHLLSRQMVKQKWATIVHFKKLTADGFYNSIVEVLHNPEYRNNVQSLSRIVRDQQNTPLERAIFWIEFTVRNNGTHLLDPESRRMSLLARSCVDIYLLLLGTLLAAVLFIRIFVNYLISTVFNDKKSKIKSN